MTASFDHLNLIDNNDQDLHLAMREDITECESPDQKLQVLLIEQKAILESNLIGIARVLDRVIAWSNPAFERMLGYSPGALNGQFIRCIFPSDESFDRFSATAYPLLEKQEVYRAQIQYLCKDGSLIWVEASGTRLNQVTGECLWMFIDISDRKQAEEKLENLEFYDPLTALPNRRLLMDRLRHAVASSSRSKRLGALLFIDLDNFKVINDRLGHDIGDQLLKQVSERLISSVREGDTVARLGGDEFVVLLEDLKTPHHEAASQTEVIGEKIMSMLNQPYQLASTEYRNTSSIGVTIFDDHTQPVEELLKQADIAMYEAKKAGRNALRFYDPQIQATMTVRLALQEALYKALSLNQFHLFYQVQVDSSGHPTGAEVLIRWIHPEHGLVSPAAFIPLAEETGMILPIGQWVLETACAQIKAWQNDAVTRRLVLSVNVSAKQFIAPDFVSQVQHLVSQHDINPELLKLELTEGMLIENIEDTIGKMRALNETGIRFSLDDFGTGFSSLQYLKRLPLDQLKIDQSFVRDIVTDTNDQAIVSTIIAMSHSLGLNVIAEGVETEAQHEILFNSGCSHYQGYLFSKPVPIEQFESLLKLDIKS